MRERTRCFLRKTIEIAKGLWTQPVTKCYKKGKMHQLSSNDKTIQEKIKPTHLSFKMYSGYGQN